MFNKPYLQSILFGVLLCSSFIQCRQFGFLPGTEVKTPSGFVKIEDIAEGSEIQSWDTSTKEVFTDKVSRISRTELAKVVTLKLGKQLLAVGPDHSFYSTTKKLWVKAIDLQVNDEIATSKGVIRIQDVSTNNLNIAAFCLSIKKNKNFIVSKDEVIAHNMAVILPLMQAITVTISKEAIVVALGSYILSRRNGPKPELNPAEQFDFSGNVGYPSSQTNAQVDRLISSAGNLNRRPVGITLDVHSEADKAHYARETEKEYARQLKEHQEKLEKIKQRQILEEKAKTLPSKTVTTITRTKGFFGWFSKEIREVEIEIITEEEYVKNKDKPLRVIQDNGSQKIVLEYKLPHKPQSSTQHTGSNLGDVNKSDEDVSINADAQEPGYPGDHPDYTPPKRWDGKKVKMQGGRLMGKYGYPDAKGKIWVPTGPEGHPRAHRGPHWDVAYPDGTGHENVLPEKKNLVQENLIAIIIHHRVMRVF